MKLFCQKKFLLHFPATIFSDLGRNPNFFLIFFNFFDFISIFSFFYIFFYFLFSIFLFFHFLDSLKKNFIGHFFTFVIFYFSFPIFHFLDFLKKMSLEDNMLICTVFGFPPLTSFLRVRCTLTMTAKFYNDTPLPRLGRLTLYAPKQFSVVFPSKRVKSLFRAV